MQSDAPQHLDESKRSFLNNGAYDVLKFVAQIGLPAVGTLYFALADLWNLANATQVVGTITAVDVFLGVLLGLSTKAYNNSDAKYDGEIHVDEHPDGSKVANLVLKNYENPADVVDQKEVTFKVKGSS